MNIIFENKKEINIEIITKTLNKWKNFDYGLYTSKFQ